MSKNIIIDIGANSGQFCIELAQRNPDCAIYAFEPVHDLANEIRHKAEISGIKNINVIEIAISNENGENEFHVSEKGDRGISSLLNLDKDNINNNVYWSSRSDLTEDSTLMVKTATLESILDEINFDQISFIKIDVQGMDLAALASAGKYLNKIQAGMIEIAALDNVSLYTGGKSLFDALDFFKQHDISIYSIKPNDPASNEFNIFFSKKDISIEKLETDLSLRDVDAYDGKWYWHQPSNDPFFKGKELQMVLNENNRLQDRIQVLDNEVNILNNEILRLNNAISKSK